MLSPSGLKTAMVVGSGMVPSSLSSTRIHSSFSSYNTYFSLKNTPAAVVALGPIVYPGSRTR